MTVPCNRCGASLPFPAELDAVVVVCRYCHATTPLAAEHVRLRQEQQRAIDERKARAAMLDDERKSKRQERTVWVLGFAGIFAIVAGSVAWSLWTGTSGSSSSGVTTTVVPVEDPESLARLTPVVQELAAQGCRHVVEAPNSAQGRVESTVQMSAGGSCLRVLAATASADVRLSATMRTPTRTEHDAVREPGADGPAEILDLEHCPTETGEHVLTFETTPEASFAHALVDCEPQREKYRDDPSRNGWQRVQGELASLRSAGCDEVLLTPETVSGEQQLTAELNGTRCTVLVAAGDADDPITVELRTPFGERVQAPDAATLVRLVYCAPTKGPHKIEVKPTTDGYFTIAGLACPKSLGAEKGDHHGGPRK
jgi:ribosomal protein L40E